MEEAVCFKCNYAFISYRALEVHLMSCDAPFEPLRSSPWAFIPPPASYASAKGPRSRHPGSQKRWYQSQITRRSSLGEQPATAARPETTTPSPPTASRKDAAGRRRNHLVTSNNTNGATCTKCGISFPDSRTLGEHFIESEAHRYAAAAPSSIWEGPAYKYKAKSTAGGNRPLPSSRTTKPFSSTPRSGETGKSSVTCDCGKTFQTNSAMTQHRKDSMRHKEGADDGKGVGRQHTDAGFPRTSNGQVVGYDGVDDITSALSKLSAA
ncbi:hypothetical protein N657DRAFT_650341 [Parathielavia appendiculata]|uniref:C2H2-type domain-containing protein n=1 Tax=Parathielavia appendiculata TaxID=2587402 RepID=A0AAN6YYW4_9PEZI|nr:hypothetical protein N657DRAFT_650341 [Parathielavia appendiculata]